MNMKQVSAVYFSPTGSTKRVMQRILKGQQGNALELDLTDAKRTRPEYWFLEDEVVLIGAPVYGGRIPETAAERFERLHGNHTPAIVVVTYGNRDYDDALLELKEQMESQGFRIVAAAAVVAEHNIVHSIGTGRPNEQDLEDIALFSARISGHLKTIKSSYRIEPVNVKGKKPYREYAGVPLKPTPDKHCRQCGLCIRKCPVQAISKTDAGVMDKERCISCMRCIAICPCGARKLDFFKLKATEAMLKKKCQVHRRAEFFYETT